MAAGLETPEQGRKAEMQPDLKGDGKKVVSGREILCKISCN